MKNTWLVAARGRQVLKALQTHKSWIRLTGTVNGAEWASDPILLDRLEVKWTMAEVTDLKAYEISTTKDFGKVLHTQRIFVNYPMKAGDHVALNLGSLMFGNKYLKDLF